MSAAQSNPNRPLVRAAYAAIMLLSLPMVAFTQTAAGRARPSAVPEEYRITPFGYFHPDCVHGLAKGDTLHLDQHLIQHADGSFDAAPHCSHARYSKSGQLISNAPPLLATEPSPSASAQAAASTSSINGWVESATVSTGGPWSYGRFQAQWTVPPNPTSTDSFVLYFFPGMQSSILSQGIATILQPVLSWTSAGWQISAWNCCESGTTFVSPYASVKAGDVILGSITNNCSPGTLTCPSWNVSIVDETTHVSEMLAHTSSFGQTFNIAFGGVLEAYNVTGCADLPPNGTISFTAISLYDENNKAVTPNWTYTPAQAGISPLCNYGAAVLTSQQVSLQYGTLVVPPPALNVQKTCTTSAGGTSTCISRMAMTDPFQTASIYYTTNGTTPTTSSSLYQSPVLVQSTETFKAIAVLKGTTSTQSVRTASAPVN